MASRGRMVWLAALVCLAAVCSAPVTAGAVEGAPGVVRGVVRNTSNGQPLGGIEVRVFDAETAWMQDPQLALVSLATTTTVADGSYEIPGMPSDALLIVAFVDKTNTYRDALFPLQGLNVRDGDAYYIDGLPAVNGYMIPLGDLKKNRTVRIWGDDRYETAIEISRQNFSSADTVILASGEAYADALAAAPLAGAYEAPLLLTRPTRLPNGLAAEIKRLKATHIIIVGGKTTVNPEIVHLLDVAGLPHPTRLAGPTRYDTSAIVARTVFNMYRGDPNQAVEPFIARGDFFADALSLSPFAYMERRPVLLTEPDRLPTATRAAWYYITDWSESNDAIIVGGPDSVSDTVLDQLADGVGYQWPELDYYRIEGPTRYSVATNLIKFYREVWWDYRGGFDMLGLASGEKFPDALAGGAAMGHQGGALLLTRSKTLDGSASSELSAEGPYVLTLECFGGSATLANTVVTAADKAMGQTVYDIDRDHERVSFPASTTAFPEPSPALSAFEVTLNAPQSGPSRGDDGTFSPTLRIDLGRVTMKQVGRAADPVGHR